MQNVGTNLL